MRKIKWLLVYPVGLIALVMMHRSIDAHLIIVMALMIVFLLLFDLRRRRS